MPRTKQTPNAIISFILILCLLLLPLGQSNAIAFSVGEEKEVGEKLLSMVRKSFQVLDDPDISQYVNDLGQRILKVAGPQYFEYHFFVINNNEFNAFAAPSGLIFIHSGLIEAMDTEGELISVMAHECGHVTSRHISDRIKKGSKTSLASAALIIAGIAMGGGAISQALITGSMAANATMNLKFSREDEEEADRLSYKWMQGMNTDPADMTAMLQKMYRVSVYRSSNIPPYLLTHPEPKQRLGYVQDLMLNTPPTKAYQVTDNFSFLRLKYRILALTKDPATLRPQLLRKASQGNEQPNIMAQYGLALISAAGADYAKAEALMQTVMQAYPQQNILKTDLAVILTQSGRQKEALALLNAAHATDPKCAYTTYTLAQNLEQSGNLKKALLLFKDLLSVIPDHAMLHHTIGNLETREGRKGVGHYYLGRYFWLEGDAKNATYHLEEALKDRTAEPAILTNAKTLLDDIERIEENN
ncbi:MAG: M48 family metalloprotease [Desulfobulbaceae bacterium]|nr:M48 family metalloprotease [Desulfobulbaceae bacterium]